MLRSSSPLDPAPEALFCLGGTIYPVAPTFDWASDLDVLVDAVRDTHAAIRNHQLALLTPTRSWLDCECRDVAAHGRQLIEGHVALIAVLTALLPGWQGKPAAQRRAPLVSQFLSSVHVLALMLVGLDVLNLLTA